MEKIVISSKARSKLDDLVDILYYNDYFSYKINAQNYVNNLYDFILTIPLKKYKTTPNPQFGPFFCSYKYNAKTTWYFIFDIKEGVYFITNITNNHAPDYVNLFDI